MACCTAPAKATCITLMALVVVGVSQSPTGANETANASDGPTLGHETPIRIAFDDGKSDGMFSRVGRGSARHFSAPDAGDWYLTAVSVYGSRRGKPDTPGIFDVTLCDMQMEPIAGWSRPHTLFQRHQPWWVRVEVPPTLVLKEFYICINPRTSRTSETGHVSVAYDSSTQGHSRIALPGNPGGVYQRGDWMIRVELVRTDRAEDNADRRTKLQAVPGVQHGVPTDMQYALPTGIDARAAVETFFALVREGKPAQAARWFDPDASPYGLADQIEALHLHEMSWERIISVHADGGSALALVVPGIGDVPTAGAVSRSSRALGVLTMGMRRVDETWRFTRIMLTKREHDAHLTDYLQAHPDAGPLPAYTDKVFSPPPAYTDRMFGPARGGLYYDFMADFDTRWTMARPKNEERPELRFIDVHASDEARSSGTAELVAMNGLKIYAADPSDWDATPEQVLHAVQQRTPLPHAEMTATDGPLPTFFLFQTRDGGAGVLRLGGAGGRPNQVTFESKIVRQSQRGKIVHGLQVSVTTDKTHFGLDEPVLVHWQIKNVGNEDRAIIWHEEGYYAPVLFEVGVRGDSRQWRIEPREVGRLPTPPHSAWSWRRVR